MCNPMLFTSDNCFSLMCCSIENFHLPGVAIGNSFWIGILKLTIPPEVVPNHLPSGSASFNCTISLFTFLETNAQVEYKVVTSVESIVPSGLGRSRIISANEQKDYKEYTTTQTEEDNTRNKSKRGDIRVKGFDETKLLNFYNIGGIRFQNIAANDAIGILTLMNPKLFSR